MHGFVTAGNRASARFSGPRSVIVVTHRAVPRHVATGVAAAPRPRAPIGVTFSGGGFRATFAALGVVRYLADAGVLGDLRYSSSVSGGSVANGMLATRWPALRERQFSPAAVDELVIGPLVKHVVASSLKTKLIRNMWRAAGRKNRTDVLAWAFDDWLFDKAELESLDPECRWIFNASNLVTGTRFGFERDVVGDYVVGLAPTARIGAARRPGRGRVGRGSRRVRGDEDRSGDVPLRRPRCPGTARRWRLRQQRTRGDRQQPVPRRVHRFHERRWRVRDRGLRQDPARARSRQGELTAVPAEHDAADAGDGRTVPGVAGDGAGRGARSRRAPWRPVRTRHRHRRHRSSESPRSRSSSPATPSIGRSPTTASNGIWRSCRRCSTSCPPISWPPSCTAVGGSPEQRWRSINPTSPRFRRGRCAPAHTS